MVRDGFEVVVNGINNNYKYLNGKFNGIFVYLNGYKVNGV